MRIAVLWLIVCLGGSAVAESGKSLYYQALSHARQGRTEDARRLLGDLAERLPADPFADDALAELARLDEEVLGQPGRALALWRRLLERYPESRLVRRAQARVAFLSQHLDQGEQVLARYQSLVSASAPGAARKAVGEMEQLLAEHPDFSLRPDGMIWMAGVLARADERDAARAVLERLIAAFPDHQAARIGLQQLARLESGRGRLDAAERAYQALAASDDAEWQAVAAEGLARLSSQRGQSRLKIAALAVWALGLALMIVLLVVLTRRRGFCGRSFRPPVEAIAFSLVLAGLAAVVFGRAQDTFFALVWMGVLCLPLLLVNGWLLRAMRLSGGGLVGWLGGLVVAWAAAVYSALALAGMVDQVLHTVQFGPG